LSAEAGLLVTVHMLLKLSSGDIKCNLVVTTLVNGCKLLEMQAVATVDCIRLHKTKCTLALPLQKIPAVGQMNPDTVLKT